MSRDLSPITFLGVDTGGTVWVDRDDYICDFPGTDLAAMRQAVADKCNLTGTVLRHGMVWDESQVDALIREQVTGSLLFTCRDCSTRPVTGRVDDRCDECGDAEDHRSDVANYTRRLG